MSLLWYLEMFLYVWLKEKYLWWSVPAWSFGFFLETECYERTVPYFSLKIPEDFSRVIFRNSLEWLFLKVLQQIRPCSKSAIKKIKELFQFMLIGCLYNYFGTYFGSLWRSLLLVKLQTFPLSSTDRRFVRVYWRDQNTV